MRQRKMARPGEMRVRSRPLVVGKMVGDAVEEDVDEGVVMVV
jgi:hypothetical protein